MDEMTQQNAALVEETTGAIQSAVGQVEDLQAAVGFFKTAQNAGQTRQAAPRQASNADTPTGNAVHAQQHKLARKVSGGGAAAALAADGEWKEF